MIDNLVELYLVKYNKVSRTKENIESITKEIKSLLDYGVPTQIMEDALIQKKIGYKEYLKDNLKDNLIEKGMFYYHPVLQILPPPPLVTETKDGDLITQDEEFSLRLKKYFSLDNLLDYVYSKFSYILPNRKKDIGALRHILKNSIEPKIKNINQRQYTSLDLLLYAIDEAYWSSHDSDIRIEVIQISSYIDSAFEALNDKVSQNELLGLNHEW